MENEKRVIFEKKNFENSNTINDQAIYSEYKKLESMRGLLFTSIFLVILLLSGPYQQSKVENFNFFLI